MTQEQPIQEFEKYEGLTEIILWFANNVGCPGTEWNRLLREINAALSANTRSPKVTSGLQWVKASDRLPLHKAHWITGKLGAHENEFPVRMNKKYYMADIYDQALRGEPEGKYSLYFNGEHHFENDFSEIEWLDESSPLPSIEEVLPSVEECETYAKSLPNSLLIWDEVLQVIKYAQTPKP